MAAPAVIRGSIVRVDGVLHLVWGLRGVGEAELWTYCRRKMQGALEAQTSLMTCVACIAMRAFYLKSLHKTRELLHTEKRKERLP